MCLVSVQNNAKSANSSFLYFWNERESPRKTASSKSKEGFLSLCQMMDRSRGMGFFASVPSIEGNPRFCLSSLFHF